VKRDIDILRKINEKSKVIVSFSFSSANDKVSSVFEPDVPSPNERLKTLSFFKKEGIACGMFLLPVIPFITDTPELIEETIRRASEIDLDFIIFGGMTIKEGRQREHLYNVLNAYDPELITKYQSIYKKNPWGHPTEEYYKSINLTFNSIAKEYGIPKRIPLSLFRGIVGENELVIVLLEHIEYLLKLKGKPSPYGYAAYSISKLKKPLSAMKDDLQSLKAVGKTTECIIKEILDTGSSSYYEKLMAE
jgi:hypothetical protein